jgi:hypothetical protein
MANVEGVSKLTAQMKALEKQGTPIVVACGFTAAYALYVHENLQAHHPVGKAKFLEEPARLLRRELGSLVAAALKAGKTLGQALLLAGLRLQAEAQRRTPVLTGHLRSSAFTRVESGAIRGA